MSSMMGVNMYKHDISVSVGIEVATLKIYAGSDTTGSLLKTATSVAESVSYTNVLNTSKLTNITIELLDATGAQIETPSTYTVTE
jgi:hypothetical protein